jgi:hypothetical protein
MVSATARGCRAGRYTAHTDSVPDNGGRPGVLSRGELGRYLFRRFPVSDGRVHDVSDVFDAIRAIKLPDGEDRDLAETLYNRGYGLGHSKKRDSMIDVDELKADALEAAYKAHKRGIPAESLRRVLVSAYSTALDSLGPGSGYGGRSSTLSFLHTSGR